MKRPRLILLLLLVAAVIWGLVQWLRPHRTVSPGGYTVADRLSQFGAPADNYWKPLFRQADLTYPPERLLMLAFKEERRLDIHAADQKGRMTFIASFPILAASGKAGLKLREGDRQVPEGFYRIELLNPNSRFHLSLRVNYPNDEDMTAAREEERDLSTLGGDIMIHGSNVSSGCLALGDPAIEKLFVLVARMPLDEVRLVIAPHDLQATTDEELAGVPSERVRELYRRLRDFQLSPSSW